jgi:hypothetical protein
MADEVVLKGDRLGSFLEIVERWRKRWDIGERAIYRGHVDSNWILVARLFRDPTSKARNILGDSPKKIEEQLHNEQLGMKKAQELERKLFYAFSRYLYAHRPDLVCTVPQGERSSARAMQEWRQLALAQHYGLPTRFLDFSTNVLVALFFAVDSPLTYRRTTKGRLKTQDSAVWCVEVPNRRSVWEVWEKDNIWLSPLEFAEEGSNPKIAHFTDTAYVPEHIDERIRMQGSVFMCEPRGKKQNWQLHTRLRDKTESVLNRETGEKRETRTLKIRIPKNSRESLKEQLDLAGINRATLFPDLESAATYLTWAIHQRMRL